MKVKAHQIKQHCWVFVNAQIENAAFDSQTKENMTLIKSKHGSKVELSDKFIKSRGIAFFFKIVAVVSFCFLDVFHKNIPINT